MREAGILLAISSLPSKYGIGDFGTYSYQFIDLLKQGGFKVWQVLPLNPLGYGNSPYQPYSSNAMDELYIDLESLQNAGWIKSKLKPFQMDSYSVSYEEVKKYKKTYLLEAFSNFNIDKDYKKFININWVKNYALFLTLKKKNELKSWNEWPIEDKDLKNKNKYLSLYENEINYEMFIQYILYKQWMKLKTYANTKGIKMIGDVPIYVGIDSEDVYSNRQDFLLDDDGHPTFIAGVPPDYFSETGQRWGNPIYHWKQLEKENFKFWVERLAYTSKLFDAVRIDHFRAFDTYWKIKAECETAIDGEWIEAPGYKLFDTLLKEIKNLNLIAEDLGELREEVLILRDHYHFPGMKIVQFTFNPYEEDTFENRENMIIYTGTHDNQTIIGWLEEKDESFIKNTVSYFKEHDYWKNNLSDSFIYFTLNSIANTAILPMQDILGYDDRARMNFPGTIGNPNWRWKMVDFKLFEDKISTLKQWLVESKRNK